MASCVAQVELEMGGVTPAGRCVSAEERRERPPVALIRNIKPEPVENGRHDVDRFRELINDDTCRKTARIADDQRNVGRLVEPAELAEDMVVA